MKSRANMYGLVALCVCGSALAGPITPPPGPVASTHKTLSEVEPRIAINATNTPGDSDSLFKITQPGSYYLTGNVTGVSGKHGIEVGASNVTLDLSGFALIGVSGSLDGINVSAFRGRNIVVRNGSVQSWGDCGVELEYNSGQPPQARIEGIRASVNGRDGISVQFSSEVVDCVVIENGEAGILAVAASVVRDCRARSNGGAGIVSGSSALVVGCSSAYNVGAGYTLAQESVIESSSASNNAVGITAQGALIRGCVVSSNVGNGIDTFDGCTIIDCTVYRNGGDGIEGSSSTTVAGCTAVDNDLNGIVVGTGSTVRDCVARLNGLNGIQAGSAALIIGNQCSSNGQDAAGGAGIHTTSSDNRIEGNNCTSQSVGVRVLSSGSIIVRNTCSGNTVQWEIAANNFYGPIINRVGVATAAVSGASASSTLGSTDPNANYSY